jgi:hypothetical protein
MATLVSIPFDGQAYTIRVLSVTSFCDTFLGNVKLGSCETLTRCKIMGMAAIFSTRPLWFFGALLLSVGSRMVTVGLTRNDEGNFAETTSPFNRLEKTGYQVFGLTQSLVGGQAICSLSDGSIALVDLHDESYPTRIVRYSHRFRQMDSKRDIFTAFENAYVFAYLKWDEEENRTIELSVLRIASADPPRDKSTSALGSALLSASEVEGDVCIANENGYLRRVHSLVLKASGSEYLRGILKPGLAETQEATRKRIRAEAIGPRDLVAIINVPKEMHEDTFNLCLDFCYTGTLPARITPEELESVFRASEYLLFPRLEQASIAWFTEAIDQDWPGDYLLAAIGCIEYKLNANIKDNDGEVAPLAEEFTRLLDRCFSRLLNSEDIDSLVFTIGASFPKVFRHLISVLKLR